MWSNVSGDGLPSNKAMVTLSLPTAIPFSNSNSLRNPSADSNQSALFLGSRTARPKWPAAPSLNGAFIAQIKVGHRKIKAVKRRDDCVGLDPERICCRHGLTRHFFTGSSQRYGAAFRR